MSKNFTKLGLLYKKTPNKHNAFTFILHQVPAGRGHQGHQGGHHQSNIGHAEGAHMPMGDFDDEDDYDEEDEEDIDDFYSQFGSLPGGTHHQSSMSRGSNMQGQAPMSARPQQSSIGPGRQYPGALPGGYHMGDDNDEETEV